MPRIRTIKPEIHQNRRVGKLSDLAYRLFTGMITIADDAGRVKAHPEELRAKLLPYQPHRTDTELSQAIAELEASGLAAWYGPNKELAHLPGWLEHQKISHPSPSRLPNPPESSESLQKIPERSSTIKEGTKERIGREGSEEGGTHQGSAHADLMNNNGQPACPAEWELVKARLDTLTWLKRPELYDWEWWKRLDEAYTDFPELDICAELSKAEAHLMAKPRKAKVMRDFRKFVMNWFRIAARDAVRDAKG